MKKAFVAVAMMLVLGLMANVALTDETVPFPFWQHSYGLATFWSISNAGATAASAVVTINLFDGVTNLLVASTTATVAPGAAWMPDSQWSSPSWYTAPEGMGFGNFDIEATTDTVYLWACVYTDLTGSNGGIPGYTIVMPGNPYGM